MNIFMLHGKKIKQTTRNMTKTPNHTLWATSVFPQPSLPSRDRGQCPISPASLDGGSHQAAGLL